MKQSPHVKAKIAAGYVLLVAASCAAIAYVLFEVGNLGRVDGYQEQLHSRRGIVNRILYHLYQAESYGQLMTAGYSSEERPYAREIRTVRGYIDSLRSVTWDSVQMLRLDSIETLVRQKERSTMRMRNTLVAGSTSGLLTENIERMLPPDSLSVPVIGPDTVVQSDTVRIRRKRRGFFRRLADLFSPPKEETGVVVSTSIRLDTLPAVTDTIAGVLRTLEQRVTDQRLAIYEKAWEEGLRLRRSNRLVNEQIYRLISAYEEDETAYLTARYRKGAALRHRSSVVLGSMAAGSIVLMLLFVAILWRDIGRANRYKRRLEEANRANEALLAAREQMMRTITHDIKAPLCSIMGYIDLLARLTDRKREQLYLQHMRSSSAHLLALVNDLLDFYRLEANKVEANRVSFAPGQLFASIAAEFAPQAEAKGIALRTELPAKDLFLAGDPFRIRQIADNLLSNALKFTDRGEVTLRAEASGGTLRFSVRDTGRGMSDEERERIFGEFVRLRSAAGSDGFGLGLSIVERLVKLLGGTIEVESRKGAGSTFTVRLPAPQAAGAPSATATEAPPEQPPTEGMRALVVDDDPLQAEMTAAMLGSLGVEAVCCPDPEGAVRLAEAQDFDLLLTDIQMPQMDGFRLLELVRSGVRGRTLPAVAVTARSDNRREDYIGRGFADILRKPFTRSELARALGSARRGAPATSEHTEAKPAATGFDALTAFATGDAAAAEAILSSFVEQQTAHAAALRRAADAGDAAALRALAHKMLPVFTMLGEREAATLLRRLDALGGEADAAARAAAVRLAEIVESVNEKAQNELSLQGDGKR